MKKLNHFYLLLLVIMLSFVITNCDKSDKIKGDKSAEYYFKSASSGTSDHYVTNHDGTITVDGPQYYFMSDNSGQQVINRQIQINEFEAFKNNYVIFIKNGHGNGEGMVSGWEIKINGKTIFGSKDVSFATIYSSKDFELPEVLILKLISTEALKAILKLHL